MVNGDVSEKELIAPYSVRTTIGVASLPLGDQIEIGMIARK